MNEASRNVHSTLNIWFVPGNTCLGLVFNYKLGNLGAKHVLNCEDTWPHLELKTQSMLCPARQSLSMFMLK